MKRIDWLIIIILILLSLFTLQSLFSSAGYFTSHDSWNHVTRMYHFDQAIRDGQFPPRWSGFLMKGFGYPLFIFTYPLPWSFAEIFVLGGLSIFTSLKLIFIITYFISALTMYFLARSLWGRVPALISSLVYIYTPYRFANIFVRGNIGESTSFAFIPFFFLGIFLIYKNKQKLGIIIASLAFSALILSHFMLLFLLLLTLICFILYFYKISTVKFKYLLSLGVAILTGILLSAYYLIPAYIYKPFTKFDSIAHTFYSGHFTPLKKLIYSPWGYAAISQPDEMSRQVGLIIWAILILAIIINLWVFFQKKNRSIYFGLGNILIFSILLSVFMMMNVSFPIWKLLEPISPIDIPWRFLAVTTFSGSLLTGYVSSYFMRSKFLLYPFLIIIVLALAYTNRNYIRINQDTHFPLSLYISSEITTNAYNEYLGREVNENAAVEKKPLIFIPDATVRKVSQKSNKISFSYNSKKENTAQIHHMYFPGWSAKIDGKDTFVQKSGIGGMEIKTPKGSHQVVLNYSSTLPMVLSNLLTVFSLIIVIVFLLKKIILRPNYA